MKLLKVLLLTIAFFFSVYPFFLQPLDLFAPLIVLASSQLKLVQLLWLSLSCGIFSDLFTSHFWGLHATCYSLATLALFYKKNINEEKLSGFLFFCLLYSLVSECVKTILLGKGIFSLSWAFYLLGKLPFNESLYCVLFIYYPLKLIEIVEKKWKLLLHKRKS